MRRGTRIFTVALTLLALLASTRSVDTWRCVTMEQRLLAPCCPDEHDAPAPGAHLDERCCEHVDAITADTAAPHERDSQAGAPTHFEFVVLPPSSVVRTVALAHLVPLAAEPPGERLARHTAILRI